MKERGLCYVDFFVINKGICNYYCLIKDFDRFFNDG